MVAYLRPRVSFCGRGENIPGMLACATGEDPSGPERVAVSPSGAFGPGATVEPVREGADFTVVAMKEELHGRRRHDGWDSGHREGAAGRVSSLLRPRGRRGLSPAVLSVVSRVARMLGRPPFGSAATRTGTPGVLVLWVVLPGVG
ncbi:hypothetical protein GCM10009670_30970 [Citricoccus alkalitolerans]